ncbi:MAG: prolipoprotein diacylglyceryl transferase [Caulobacterales bacterium]
MPFPNIHPEIFSLGPFNLFGMQLGPFALRWYALAYIAGLFLGWRYLVYLSKRPALWGRDKAPYTEADSDEFIVAVTLGVILGGRLGYILFYRPDLIGNPMEMLAVWNGGMSFHGGLIGVIVATLLTARWRKIPLLALGDAAAAAAPIGLFFGRIANFINGELWGRPTDAPWGVVFPMAGPEPRHPSQLYECVLEGLVLFTILTIATHRFKTLARPGLNFGIFLVGYAIARVLLEGVREPDRHMPHFPFGLTMGMMLSIPMFIGGALFIWNAVKKSPPPSGAPA